jgi:hypothetical protein
MTNHGWQMSLIDGKWYKSQEESETIFRSKTIILTLMPNLPPGSFQEKYYPGWIYYPKYEEIQTDSSIEAVLEVFELRELVDAKLCPFTTDKGIYPSPEEYERQLLNVWATEWARKVVDKQVTEAFRTFIHAQQAMTTAYGKLFELEQTMRAFVEQTLQKRYPTDWWSKIDANVARQVETRERNPMNVWLDDFSQTRLKFAGFDGLRLIVIKNPALVTA